MGKSSEEEYVPEDSPIMIDQDDMLLEDLRRDSVVVAQAKKKNLPVTSISFNDLEEILSEETNVKSQKSKEQAKIISECKLIANWKATRVRLIKTPDKRVSLKDSGEIMSKLISSPNLDIEDIGTKEDDRGEYIKLSEESGTYNPPSDDSCNLPKKKEDLKVEHISIMAGLVDCLDAILEQSNLQLKQKNIDRQDSYANTPDELKGDRKRRERYKKDYEKPFTRIEIYNWYACVLYAILYDFKSIEEYFKFKPREGFEGLQSNFFYSRFTRDRFYLLNSCVSIIVEEGQEIITAVNDFYKSTSVIAGDETCFACKSKMNPAHTMAPSKPKKNVIMFTSSADSNKVIGGFKIRGRTADLNLFLPHYMQTPENFDRVDHVPQQPIQFHTEMEAVVKKQAQPNSVSVTDRLYSGIQLLKQFGILEKAIVMKCKSDRPSFLFKNLLHKLFDKSTSKVGDYAYGIGDVALGGKVVRFKFLTVVEKKDLSTGKLVFGNYMTSLDLSCDLQASKIVETQDYSKEGQVTTYSSAIWETDTLVAYYYEKSGFIDQCNDTIARLIPNWRVPNWNTKVALGFLAVVTNNIRSLNNHFSGKYDDLRSFCCKMIQLVSPTILGPKKHRLLCISKSGYEKRTRKPLATNENIKYQQDTNKKSSESFSNPCKICKSFTSTYCTGCQTRMCRSCFDKNKLGEDHEQYFHTESCKKNIHKSRYSPPPPNKFIPGDDYVRKLRTNYTATPPVRKKELKLLAKRGRRSSCSHSDSSSPKKITATRNISSETMTHATIESNVSLL